MNAKKVLSLIAAGILLFTIGCKKDDTQKGHSSNGDDVIDDYTSHLHVEDMDGYNFRILIRPGNGMITDQYIEEGSEDPIEDAVYKRNKIVEKMFNINIVATPSSGENAQDAITTILAGDDAFDVVFPHTGVAFQYAQAGAVHNLLNIDTIDLTKPWWSKDIIENCTLGGNLYVLDGDISLHRLKFAMCLFFNKNIFDELGIEYPYDLVEEGEWTFDEFEALVKQGAKDLDGDGVMTPENDRYGLAASMWDMPINCIYTGGQRIYSKNEEGLLELTLNTTKTVDIYDSYFDLMDSEASFLENSANKVGPDFKAGRAMFMDGNLGQAQTMRSMEDNFGIIPYPKFTYDDEYAQCINGAAHLFVIPVTVEDEIKTGAVIEALCAIGSRDVVPVFYEQSLKTKFTRDNESEAMIDLIKDTVIYDVGYATGHIGYIGNQLAESTNHDFSSFYASREAQALKRVADINEEYAGYVAD